MVAQRKQAGAPRNNKNRQGTGKKKPRLPINMSISDHSEISEGVYVDLRRHFEDYLEAQGKPSAESDIRKLARDWAYECWWHRLSHAEDDQAIIL